MGDSVLRSEPQASTQLAAGVGGGQSANGVAAKRIVGSRVNNERLGQLMVA